MNRAYKYSFYSAAATAVFLSGFSHLALAIDTAHIKDVANCADDTSPHKFLTGEQIYGKGEHFHENSDYRWTIVKDDEPGKGIQVADGNFQLGAGAFTFCIELGQADTVAGDDHAEYLWTVEIKETDATGAAAWKKVSSDHLYVQPGNNQTQPTTLPTNSPTPTGTSTLPTVTPTSTPSATTTPTPDSSTNTANPTATPTPEPKVQGIQTSIPAKTMAATGTFENTIMNSLLAAGMMILSLGAVSYAKEKKA